MLIILTGVPGTGKTYFSTAFKKFGYDVVSINELAIESGLFKEVGGEKIVNLKALGARLLEKVSKIKRDAVIEGHLACEIEEIGTLKPQICIVLRKRPHLLKKILEKRGYSERKIKDNLECELIDYCGTKCKEIGRIYELDVDNKREVKRVMNAIKKRKVKVLKDKYIDWLDYYSKSERKEFEKFIEWLVR